MPGTPTTKYAIPTFNATGTDPVNTGHTQINSALTTIDGAMAGYATGTFAGKPAAGKAGRIYLCTDTGQWLFDTGSAWVDANTAPALVSSLPVSPYDGQEIYFAADPTNGVVWHLRYRSASASAYKWELIGGGAWVKEVATSQSYTAGVYGDPATVGPEITLPVVGDYEIAWGAYMAGTLIGGTGLMGVGVRINGTSPSNSTEALLNITGSAQGASVGASGRRTVTNAASPVRVQYFANNVSGFSAASRFLSIRPIRVG